MLSLFSRQPMLLALLRLMWDSMGSEALCRLAVFSLQFFRDWTFVLPVVYLPVSSVSLS